MLYILFFLIILIVYLSYKLGKQSTIINNIKSIKKKNYEKVNDINIVIDKLQNNSF